MKLLDYTKYEKVLPAIKAAEINTMFARSVLERKTEGKVFVDDLNYPAAYYILHPYGMALLYGDIVKEDFRKELFSYLINENKVRNRSEYLQVYPETLYPFMDNLLQDNLVKPGSGIGEAGKIIPAGDRRVQEYQRINFQFNLDKYLEFKQSNKTTGDKILETSEVIYNQLNKGVVPKFFWNSYRDFNHYGIGYTLLTENECPASTAFAAFVLDNRLEIGIETDVKYHGLGYGSRVGSKLIDYCITNGYEPVWSCDSRNIGSRKLAMKLGFEVSKIIPCYILPL